MKPKGKLSLKRKKATKHSLSRVRPKRDSQPSEASVSTLHHGADLNPEAFGLNSFGSEVLSPKSKDAFTFDDESQSQSLMKNVPCSRQLKINLKKFDAASEENTSSLNNGCNENIAIRSDNSKVNDSISSKGDDECQESFLNESFTHSQEHEINKLLGELGASEENDAGITKAENSHRVDSNLCSDRNETPRLKEKMSRRVLDLNEDLTEKTSAHKTEVLGKLKKKLCSKKLGQYPESKMGVECNNHEGFSLEQLCQKGYSLVKGKHKGKHKQAQDSQRKSLGELNNSLDCSQGLKADENKTSISKNSPVSSLYVRRPHIEVKAQAPVSPEMVETLLDPSMDNLSLIQSSKISSSVKAKQSSPLLPRVLEKDCIQSSGEKLVNFTCASPESTQMRGGSARDVTLGNDDVKRQDVSSVSDKSDDHTTIAEGIVCRIAEGDNESDNADKSMSKDSAKTGNKSSSSEDEAKDKSSFCDVTEKMKVGNVAAEICNMMSSILEHSEATPSLTSTTSGSSNCEEKTLDRLDGKEEILSGTTNSFSSNISKKVDLPNKLHVNMLETIKETKNGLEVGLSQVSNLSLNMRSLSPVLFSEISDIGSDSEEITSAVHYFLANSQDTTIKRDLEQSILSEVILSKDYDKSSQEFLSEEQREHLADLSNSYASNSKSRSSSLPHTTSCDKGIEKNKNKVVKSIFSPSEKDEELSQIGNSQKSTCFDVIVKKSMSQGHKSQSSHHDADRKFKNRSDSELCTRNLYQDGGIDVIKKKKLNLRLGSRRKSQNSRIENAENTEENHKICKVLFQDASGCLKNRITGPELCSELDDAIQSNSKTTSGCQAEHRQAGKMTTTSAEHCNRATNLFNFKRKKVKLKRKKGSSSDSFDCLNHLTEEGEGMSQVTLSEKTKGPAFEERDMIENQEGQAIDQTPVSFMRTNSEKEGSCDNELERLKEANLGEYHLLRSGPGLTRDLLPNLKDNNQISDGGTITEVANITGKRNEGQTIDIDNFRTSSENSLNFRQMCDKDVNTDERRSSFSERNESYLQNSEEMVGQLKSARKLMPKIYKKVSEASVKISSKMKRQGYPKRLILGDIDQNIPQNLERARESKNVVLRDEEVPGPNEVAGPKEVPSTATLKEKKTYGMSPSKKNYKPTLICRNLKKSKGKKKKKKKTMEKEHKKVRTRCIAIQTDLTSADLESKEMLSIYFSLKDLMRENGFKWNWLAYGTDLGSKEHLKVYAYTDKMGPSNGSLHELQDDQSGDGDGKNIFRNIENVITSTLCWKNGMSVDVYYADLEVNDKKLKKKKKSIKEPANKRASETAGFVKEKRVSDESKIRDKSDINEGKVQQNEKGTHNENGKVVDENHSLKRKTTYFSHLGLIKKRKKINSDSSLDKEEMYAGEDTSLHGEKKNREKSSKEQVMTCSVYDFQSDDKHIIHKLDDLDKHERKKKRKKAKTDMVHSSPDPVVHPVLFSASNTMDKGDFSLDELVTHITGDGNLPEGKKKRKKSSTEQTFSDFQSNGKSTIHEHVVLDKHGRKKKKKKAKADLVHSALNQVCHPVLGGSGTVEKGDSSLGEEVTHTGEDGLQPSGKMKKKKSFKRHLMTTSDNHLTFGSESAIHEHDNQDKHERKKKKQAKLDVDSVPDHPMVFSTNDTIEQERTMIASDYNLEKEVTHTDDDGILSDRKKKKISKEHLLTSSDIHLTFEGESAIHEHDVQDKHERKKKGKKAKTDLVHSAPNQVFHPVLCVGDIVEKDVLPSGKEVMHKGEIGLLLDGKKNSKELLMTNSVNHLQFDDESAIHEHDVLDKHKRKKKKKKKAKSDMDSSPGKLGYPVVLSASDSVVQERIVKAYDPNLDKAVTYTGVDEALPNGKKKRKKSSKEQLLTNLVNHLQFEGESAIHEHDVIDKHERKKKKKKKAKVAFGDSVLDQVVHAAVFNPSDTFETEKIASDSNVDKEMTHTDKDGPLPDEKKKRKKSSKKQLLTSSVNHLEFDDKSATHQHEDKHERKKKRKTKDRLGKSRPVKIVNPIIFSAIDTVEKEVSPSGKEVKHTGEDELLLDGKKKRKKSSKEHLMTSSVNEDKHERNKTSKKAKIDLGDKTSNQVIHPVVFKSNKMLEKTKKRKAKKQCKSQLVVGFKDQVVQSILVDGKAAMNEAIKNGKEVKKDKKSGKDKKEKRIYPKSSKNSLTSHMFHGEGSLLTPHSKKSDKNENVGEESIPRMLEARNELKKKKKAKRKRIETVESGICVHEKENDVTRHSSSPVGEEADGSLSKKKKRKKKENSNNQRPHLALPGIADRIALDIFHKKEDLLSKKRKKMNKEGDQDAFTTLKVRNKMKTVHKKKMKKQRKKNVMTVVSRKHSYGRSPDEISEISPAVQTTLIDSEKADKANELEYSKEKVKSEMDAKSLKVSKAVKSIDTSSESSEADERNKTLSQFLEELATETGIIEGRALKEDHALVEKRRTELRLQESDEEKRLEKVKDIKKDITTIVGPLDDQERQKQKKKWTALYSSEVSKQKREKKLPNSFMNNLLASYISAAGVRKRPPAKPKVTYDDADPFFIDYLTFPDVFTPTSKITKFIQRCKTK